MFGGELFGGQRFADYPKYLQGTGIPSQETFGANGSVQQQLHTIPGISSAEAFGTTNSHINQVIYGTGIPSALVIGTASKVQQSLHMTSIGSAEVVSTGDILNQLIRGTGIGTGLSFGNSALNIMSHLVGVSSSTVFGSNRLDRVPIYFNLAQISSSESFGTSQIIHAVGHLAALTVSEVNPISAAIAHVDKFGAMTINENSKWQPLTIIKVAKQDPGTIREVPGLGAMVR